MLASIFLLGIAYDRLCSSISCVFCCVNSMYMLAYVTICIAVDLGRLRTVQSHSFYKNNVKIETGHYCVDYLI